MKRRIPLNLLIINLLFNAHLLIGVTINQAQGFASALQSNGNLLVAGGALASKVNECIVARYLSTGTLDSSFGSAGVTLTPIGTYSQAFAIVVQPSDGNSIIAGYCSLNGINQVAMARYLASNGTLDSTFGSGGIVSVPVGDAVTINDSALDANNNVLLVGTTVQSGITQILLMRFTSSGVPDSTFNGNGIVLLPLNVRALGTSLAIQAADGKIVISGYYFNPSVSAFQSVIARYNTDGTADTTFGNNGVANSPITVTSVNVQANGSIVACGSSGNSLALAQFTSAGILDTSFGSNGVVTTTIGSKAQANDLAFDASNNIVVTGFSDSQLLVARYTAAGALDLTFNVLGYNTLLLIVTNVGNSVVIQPNGMILCSGYADDDFLVARYATNGLIDLSWGTNGIVLQPSGSAIEVATRLWEQEPVGTNGGTFTSGAWQTRKLNQLLTSDSAIALANNQFTIPAGTYQVQINAPAYRVGNHQVRLQNITDNLTSLWGLAAFSNVFSGSMTISSINNQLTVNKTTTFEVQHMCSVTQNNDGFGIAAGFGALEMYTTVAFTSN